MKAYPLLFTPSFHERIWGGTRLRDFYGYPITGERTGEAWVISDHPNGMSRIANGPYKGYIIGDILQKHPEWFAERALSRFPLLVKLLDAKEDLSVQVHPDDAFAAVHEHGEYGKAESWYIVHADPQSEIICGHTAATREELADKAAKDQWRELLIHIPVRTGDFFYIPQGTIHALGKGILVLEIQQNSDITYRAYDYNRVDESGKKRKLHLDKVLQVTRVPHLHVPIHTRISQFNALQIIQYIECPFFCVEKWILQGIYRCDSKRGFILLSLLSGAGRLVWGDGELQIKKGHHLLIPRGIGRYIIDGEWEGIVSYLPKKVPPSV